MSRKRNILPLASNASNPTSSSKTPPRLPASPSSTPNKKKKAKHNYPLLPSLGESILMSRQDSRNCLHKLGDISGDESLDSFDIFNEPFEFIRKKQDNIISSKSLTIERNNVKMHLIEDFKAIEHRLMVTNDTKVSDSPVQVSSCLPLVLPGEDHP